MDECITCSRVTSSDGMNLSDVFSVSPSVSWYFLVQRIHLSNFYVKHKFPCFRRKFGDQSTLRAVDFRLEERITACIVGASVRAVLARPLVGPMVVRGCMLRGIPLESEELLGSVGSDQTKSLKLARNL